MENIKSQERLNFIFKSSDHLRYENGVHISGPHGGAARVVKVEPNINGNEGHTVTIFTVKGVHPLWQDNIMMAPKPMKTVSENESQVILRGYGYDELSGAPFANYGMTLFYSGNKVTRCVLHLHDRNVDMDYQENL